MAQQISPFIEAKYGWGYGADNWDPGMDENLLKFSFMFDGRVDGVVGSLPAAVNGQSYFLTTDKRLYFAVGTTWYSSPCPQYFVFKIKSTGDYYQYDGSNAVQIDSPAQAESRFTSIEATLTSLGTAAFEDVADLATQAELDIASAQANAYTDTLRDDLADPTDPAKGAAMVGYQGGTVADKLAQIVEEAVDQIQTVLSKPSRKISELEYPLLISHRGGSLPYPEHTMKGYIRSYLSGYLPEIDIQALADDELLCIHDSTVDRTMGLIEGPVSSFTRPQIEKAYVKNSHNKCVDTEHPVFFEDLLDELGGKIVLVPEIKAGALHLTNKIINAVKDRGLDDYVLFQSFDYDCCKQVATAGLEVVFLSSNMPTQTPSQIVADGINFVGGSHNNYTQANVQALKSAGLKVFGYTINTKADLEEWIDVKGADGAFSDDPWYLEDKLTPRASLDFSDGEDLIGSYAQYLDSQNVSNNVRVPISSITRQSQDGLSLYQTESRNVVMYFPQLGRINLPCQIRVDMTVPQGDLAVFPDMRNYAGVLLLVPEQEQDIVNDANPDKLLITAVSNGTSWVSDKLTINRKTLSPLNLSLDKNSFGRKTLIFSISETDLVVNCPEDGIYETATWNEDASLYQDMLLGLRASSGATFHKVEVLEYGSVKTSDHLTGINSYSVEVPNGYAKVSSDGTIVAYGRWSDLPSPGADVTLTTNWDLSILPLLTETTTIVTPSTPNPDSYSGVSVGGSGSSPVIYTKRSITGSHYFSAVLYGRWK